MIPTSHHIKNNLDVTYKVQHIVTIKHNNLGNYPTQMKACQTQKTVC